MAEFLIQDSDLTGFKNKVAIITGGSSGIGLATVELLISLGARVISGDLQAPPTPGDFLFVKTDATSWADLVKLFQAAKDKHGRVDYVFANAGIGPRANYLALEVDENGVPQKPNHDTLKTNLDSVVDTATLAVHYMKDNSEGGSIVLMGSSTGLQPFRGVDYATAKSGVLGFGRSFALLVEAAGMNIKVNTLAPSWTATQVLPNIKDLLAAVSVDCMPASVVARAAAYLMATKSRNGEIIFVRDGKFTEIQNAVLGPAYESIKGDTISDDAVLVKVMALGS